MARYTITPWKRASDLLTVRQQLYRLNNDDVPNAQDLRRHAIDRIMAWKLRSNLPHAIESTALLIDAQFHHQNATSPSPSGPTISEFSIRAVYAAAFTRFVTGFCDIGRARERGLEQSSMLAIAKQIGMPAEFVALRHEATHEELPGLRRLIGAVERGLEWLWVVYWARLEEGEGCGGGVEMRGEVVGLLRGYRRERRDQLRKGPKQGDELAQSTIERCLSLCRSKREAADIVADVLVEERLLLPTSRSLGEPMDGAYMIWDDMLASFDRRIPAFLYSLIEQLFMSITTQNDTRPQDDTSKEAHALWLLHLSQTIAGDHNDKIMQHCCLHPGHWTQFIGESVLEGGDDLLRENWQSIFDASVLGNKSGDDGVTPDEVLPRTEAMEMEMDVGTEESGRWQRAIVPSSLPIGVAR